MKNFENGSFNVKELSSWLWRTAVSLMAVISGSLNLPFFYSCFTVCSSAVSVFTRCVLYYKGIRSQGLVKHQGHLRIFLWKCRELVLNIHMYLSNEELRYFCTFKSLLKYLKLFQLGELRGSQRAIA